MPTTSSQMISQELDSINAWVEETEKVINSQASFDTFQPAASRGGGDCHEVPVRVGQHP